MPESLADASGLCDKSCDTWSVSAQRLMDMPMITDLLLGTLDTKRHHACTCTQYRTVPDQLAIAMQRRCNDCINPFGNWTA